MDKYTKALMMVVRIPIGLMCILAGLGLLGVSIWVSTFSDVASMILLISFLGGGALINFGVGYAFLGDEYKATHIVRGGDTTFTPITSVKFLKRTAMCTPKTCVQQDRTSRSLQTARKYRVMRL